MTAIEFGAEGFMRAGASSGEMAIGLLRAIRSSDDLKHATPWELMGDSLFATRLTGPEIARYAPGAPATTARATTCSAALRVVDGEVESLERPARLPRASLTDGWLFVRVRVRGHVSAVRGRRDVSAAGG